MAQQTPAYVIGAASHSAALFRQAYAAPLHARNGVMDSGTTLNEYLVTQQASPNMSVLVAPGRCTIQGTQLSPPSGYAWSPQGQYFGLNDAPATVTLAAANATNPRVDTIYVAVQDAFYSGATNQVIIGVVTGTPGVSPAPGTLPANAIPLAYIAVVANATSITNANISDARIFTGARGGVLRSPGSATYPPSPVDGQYTHDLTTGALMRYSSAAVSWLAVPTEFYQAGGSTMFGAGLDATKPIYHYWVHQAGTSDGTNGLILITMPGTASGIIAQTEFPTGSATFPSLVKSRSDLNTATQVVYQTRNFSGAAAASLAYDNLFYIMWQL